jgi:phenylacetate-CoA ligase
MQSPAAWPEILRIEPDFDNLERSIRAGKIQDYRTISPEMFAYHAWDLIPQARLFQIILPFLRQQISRARATMPDIYGRHLDAIDPGKLQAPQDWYAVPLLVKDDDPETGLAGFRQMAADHPESLRPSDMKTGSIAFASGGSLGTATPTYVSLADRAREVHAWRRGHTYHGLVPGDHALYTYNTTHKGGQWMQESLLIHGVDTLLRRPEENAFKVLNNIRDYGINVLFTVQQPYESMQAQHKAAGINLHTLIMASLEHPETRGVLLPDDAGRSEIEFIFLGGFPIVPYALELIDEYLQHIPFATLLGSSEAIPQACSTNPHLTPGAACHNNHLHLLQAPHYVEVVKPSGKYWVPVEKGETGLLVYTSWARDGTIWIRYAPGDIATLALNEGECTCGLVSPVISDVQRRSSVDQDDLLLFGCAAG